MYFALTAYPAELFALTMGGECLLSPDTRDNNAKHGPHGYQEYHRALSQGVSVVWID